MTGLVWGNTSFPVRRFLQSDSKKLVVVGESNKPSCSIEGFSFNFLHWSRTMPSCSSIYACGNVNQEPEVRCWPSSPSQMESENAGAAIVIMGVSGAGKTTIGKLLAETINCTFLDADDFHSDSNKAKMSKGIPLTDDDRTPWLESLRDSLSEFILRGKTVVLACSALRKKYREILRSAAAAATPKDQPVEEAKVKFVLLEVPAELLVKRLSKREAEGQHFMSSTLLKSQLDLLEINEAEAVIHVDGRKNAVDIVSDIVDNIVCLRNKE